MEQEELQDMRRVVRLLSNRPVLFADEFGYSILLEAVRNPTVCVYDPKRPGMEEYVKTNMGALRVRAHPSKKDRARFVEELSQFKPSLGVVFSYSRILWPELIKLFRFGVVNLHGGKLPEYRGANVLQWAIINGEIEIAMTLHYIDEGVDTGPVIDEIYLPIEFDDTALTLRDKAGKAAARLLEKWLPTLVKRRVKAHPQVNEWQVPPANETTWPRRKPEDSQINWKWSDQKIRNFIRALVDPWPNAFYFNKKGDRIQVKQVPSLEEIAALRKEV